MKKSTFLATLLMLMFAMSVKAELMDKPFYKMVTFGTIQASDITNVTAPATGTNPISVKNVKTNNTPRYLYTKWGEAAYANCPAELPETGYSFSTDFTISADAGQGNTMELVLAPEDASFSINHMRLFSGNEYFFRMHQAGVTVNQEATIYINGDVQNNANWNFGETEGTKAVMTVGTKYNIRVTVSKDGSKASYIIKEAETGTVLSEGDKDISALTNKHIGLFWFNAAGACTYDFDNVNLSTVVEGPFANEPTSDLISVMKTERDYYVNFKEGETLHWIQLGDATDVITGETYNNGEEYELSYESADDNSTFEPGEGEFLGNKIIYCTVSGNLRMWTTLDSNGSRSADVVVPVVCEEVVMPTPKATITNVSEGYAKEYTLTADNSETLLNPTVTIHYTIKGAAGNLIKEGNALSGEKVNVEQKGSLEIYSWDQTHEDDPWYAQSDVVTVENNAEYVEATSTNYALTKDECSTAKTGFTVSEIVESSNKSRWDRIYSTQKYGYNENNETTGYVDGTDYAWVKEGHGFYDMSAIGTTDAKWNALVPEDPTTAFAPLAPTEAFTGNSKYVASAWNIFPLEGIVYYNTSVNYATLTLDSRYTSDDANKPNFYVVHTRGGYDRPDKGNCNVYTVCVAGEDYSLYRYDTALCDVKVMTYKGFVPGIGTGISSVNANETSAPAVKKVVTKNGVVIVKGDKIYSVSGTQLK